MDPLSNKKNPEIPKQTALNPNLLPLMIPRPRFQHHQSISSSINSYSPDHADSPLLKYLRSNSPAGSSFSSPATVKFQFPGSTSGRRSSVSPLSAVDNLEAVDGILVASVSSGRRISSRSAADSCFCGPGSALSSTTSSSSSSVNRIIYKAEICRSWEDNGHCRFGSKCQFAHGKEELHPRHFPPRNKSEAQLSKSFTTSGSKSCFPPQQAMAEAAISMAESTSHIKLEPSGILMKSNHTGMTTKFKDSRNMLSSSSPLNSAHGNKNTTITMTKTMHDWSPIDDDIEVALPWHSENCHQSKEEIDGRIRNVLFGSNKRRLPVFTQMCPE